MAEQTPPTGPSGPGEDQSENPEKADPTDETPPEEQAAPKDDSEDGGGDDGGNNGDGGDKGEGDGGDGGDDGGSQYNKLDKTIVTLQKAIKESLKLARYATRQAIQIPDDALKDLVTASKNVSDQGLDTETEFNFWKAYRELSQTVHPVSIESVQACSSKRVDNTTWYMKPFIKKDRKGRKKITMAWASAINYTTLTLCVLAVLLALQIYWIIGSTLTGDIRKIGSELAQLDKDQQPLILSQKELNRAQKFLRETKVVEDEKNKIQEKISSNQSSLEEVQSKIDSNVDRRDQRNKSLNAAFVLLDDWSTKWRWAFGAEPQKEPIFFLRWIESDEDKTARIKKAKKEIDLGKEIALTSAETVLKSMSSYILPLLYGLLGACAFILRTLAYEISTVSFSSASRVQFRLRWPLGMLAGIAVGWFFPTDTLPKGLEALQPLALAFLAGYGVELLFTGLDKMVDAFTGKAPGAKRIPAGPSSPVTP